MSEKLNASTRTRANSPRRLLAIAMIAAPCAASTAEAQWVVTTLHPSGATYSFGLGASGSQQVGEAQTHARLWTGSNATSVDLHPSGSTNVSSTAFTAQNGKQGGYVSVGTITPRAHAALWYGTATSWVDMHPAGVRDSVVNAIDGDMQGGFVSVNNSPNLTHASLWSGSAASWIDIHPMGGTVDAISIVLAMAPGVQVGKASNAGFTLRAALWRGTPASWRDLNPMGATESQATAAVNDRVYGSATFAGVSHAGQWEDTAASWVDFHPAGAASSVIYGAVSDLQVGSANIGGSEHASAWNGSAESWVDLHSFLTPGSAIGSHASAVSRDVRFTYVVGYSIVDSSPGGRRATLWTRCNVDLSGDGSADSPDFFAFIAAFFNDEIAADFNRDATVNSQDFFDFLGAFFAGC